jgi:hypothetical protein
MQKQKQSVIDFYSDPRRLNREGLEMIGILQFYKVPTLSIAYGYTKKKHCTQKQQKISPPLFTKDEPTSSSIYWTTYATGSSPTESRLHHEVTIETIRLFGLPKPTDIKKLEL